MKYFFSFLPLSLLALPMSAQIDTDVTIQPDTSVRTVVDVPEALIMSETELMNNYTNRNNLTPAADQGNTRDNPYNDDIIRERLSCIPTTIDLPLNDITRTYIDTYTNRMKRSVAVMLGASNFYMPIFEEALERYDLPYELRYLPVIESGLRPDVTSHAGAAGLWQFIPAAGKQYGLEINTLVDERRDPIKSSEAAAHLLSDLYKRFGDWSLAIAAYNCGEYNVQKALIRAGGKEGGDFWSIYNYLPRETRGYVPAFIAANYIMTYYCEHGITPMAATLPAASDTIVVSHDARFTQIASVCNVTVDELRSLNPQYRRDIVPRNYAVRLPAQSLESFILNEDKIYGIVPMPSTPVVSTEAQTIVSSDESVAVVAPVESAVIDSLVAAQQPVATTPVTPTAVSSRAASSSSSRNNARNNRRQPQTKTVSVKSGDTLSQIAARNGTTVDRIRKLNGIKGSIIHPGQKLRVK